jgi:hypothetical protein
MLMRYLVLPAAALAAIAAPAAAQEAPAPNPEAAQLVDQLQDPAHQHDVAMMAQTMTEIVLDMPLAPLVKSAAEKADAQAGRVDPDLTLRKLVPEAGQVSAAIGRTTPRAMQAAGSLVGAMAAMTPVLRDMAERMAAALPEKK